MSVIVDSPIWSLAFRRNQPEPTVTAELRRLLLADEALLLGAVRQEVLSGIRERERFERLRDYLAEFPDLPARRTDYELAADLFNTCRTRGVQGSNTDFLLCATAIRLGIPIYTTDRDFETYAEHFPIELHAPEQP